MPKVPRKRPIYSEETLSKALESINKGATLGNAAKAFGIP